MKYLYRFIMIFLFIIACKTNETIDICSDYEDKVYKYIVYNCTDADSLNCHQKVIKSLLLPEQYLKCSSTDSLTRSCLAYPYLGHIWLYNSIQQGFDHIMDMFNGFGELFTREDANISLIKVYQEMDPKGINAFSDPVDRGTFMTQFTFIEITLSQFKLINKLTPEETEMLIEICLDKYYDKSIIASYGWIGEMSGLAIIARILYSHDYKTFTNELTNISELNYFIESADFAGLNNIEGIIKCIIINAENYLIELKNKNNGKKYKN